MIDCKSVETPIIANHGLGMIKGEKMANREQYQRMVGNLIYLSHTRPNITYAVGGSEQIYVSATGASYDHSYEDLEIFKGYKLQRYLVQEKQSFRCYGLYRCRLSRRSR